MVHDGFRPAWWLPGRHAQTLGARMLRRRGGVRFDRERLELADGDFVDLDWPTVAGAPKAGGAPLVVVLHGLEGSARSAYALQAYRELALRGLATIGLNFRSCGGELNRLPRLYHSGDTDDLRSVVAALAARFPGRTIGALGFSLGGNVLLKYLAESSVSTVSAAVAVSVPFDLAASAEEIERGIARAYRRHLVGRLQRKVRAKRELLRGEVDVNCILRARTFREFDDAATAPLHGFEGVDHYYGASSSRRFLGAIGVPTLLISAYDDPFLPASVLREVARAVEGQQLEVRFTPQGGHVGFVTGKPWAPRFWAELTAAAFLAKRLGQPGRTAETTR